MESIIPAWVGQPRTPKTSSSVFGSKDIRKRQAEGLGTAEDRQYNSSSIQKGMVLKNLVSLTWDS